MRSGNRGDEAMGAEGGTDYEDTGRAESLHDPLLYILTDHDRQRVIAASLERLAEDLAGPDVRDAASYIRGYLLRDLIVHVADEEEDLVPTLARRVLPEDGFDALLGKMKAEHDLDEAERKTLLAGLEALAAGRVPQNPKAFAQHAQRFAGQTRRHLAWENGTILELARRRLTAADLKAIAAGMARRRGLLPP